MKRAVLLLCLAGCSTGNNGSLGGEPEHVTVDHILIGVKQPGLDGVTRDATQARQLAYDLLDQLEKGGDWAALKRKHSDDPPPGGPYRMANRGATLRDSKEFARAGMVRSFGDVSFALDVGEMGMADYDRDNCKWGFHIVKRVK